MAEYSEREAAIEAVKKERDYTGKFTFEEEHGWAVGFQQGITFALSDIAAIPAADVRPVVRGEWEWEMYQYTPHCSICGGAGFPGPANGKRYNFCPNCGADMRTGAE